MGGLQIFHATHSKKFNGLESLWWQRSEWGLRTQFMLSVRGKRENPILHAVVALGAMGLNICRRSCHAAWVCCVRIRIGIVCISVLQHGWSPQTEGACCVAMRACVSACVYLHTCNPLYMRMVVLSLSALRGNPYLCCTVHAIASMHL